ncbi:hypothetical protein BN979_03923 [Mycolicibacterium vulneris]|nr:hypothetical protein [Mycolicibacterium porcinum]CDO31110.1 hypothetical protein BN979_03923 [Mycolicibacterium vulneris]
MPDQHGLNLPPARDPRALHHAVDKFGPGDVKCVRDVKETLEDNPAMSALNLFELVEGEAGQIRQLLGGISPLCAQTSDAGTDVPAALRRKLRAGV